jgi:hypothetical protein
LTVRKEKCLTVFILTYNFSLQQHPSTGGYMDVTLSLSQQIPNNQTMDSSTLSGLPNTETPPPGYMSEDGDQMDQNDNLSELLVIEVQISAFYLSYYPLQFRIQQFNDSI